MRAFIEAFRSLETYDAASIVVHFHPEVEFLPLRATTEGAFHGHAGIERFHRDTVETFERFELDVEVEPVGDRVLWWGTIHARSRASEIDVEVPTAALIELRDGRVWRYEDFGPRECALSAAGKHARAGVTTGRVARAPRTAALKGCPGGAGWRPAPPPVRRGES